MNEIERRASPKQHVLEARTEGNQFRLGGYAAVFDKYSQPLGGFVERIAPEAFKRTLDSDPDVRALFNHDSNMPLGRTRAQTLALFTDSEGLGYDISLPDTSYARDLYESVQRGDVNQSSFGFYVQDDIWTETEDGMPLRTLTRVSLHNGDVSPVTYPAYEDTAVSARAMRALAEIVPEKIETTDNESGTPQSAPTPPLSLYARRLELLARRASVAR